MARVSVPIKPFSALLSALLISLLNPSIMFGQAPAHEKVILKGFDGSPLTPDSKMPYSPRKTCGACHDYERITEGYHFQQGRTDGTGTIVVSDEFDPKAPWNRSAGMYGKHSLIAFDSSQLSPKTSQTFSEMDKSSFFFAQHCGACHPGGGFGEYDRKGNRYYDEETGKLGSEVSDDQAVRDGDYTAFSEGKTAYGAPWNNSGLSEADCLICHLKGYRWNERSAGLKQKLFRFGPTLGAGWAGFKSGDEGSAPSESAEVTVDYTNKEVADFENLPLQIVRKPSDENCWSCHATGDGTREYRSWNSENDVHKAKGFQCVTCHPGNREHNFAKGNSLHQTVRDDLDNTMHSCEDCHYKGKYRKAPRFKHAFSPRHMKILACETCHIPFQSGAASLVYDHASTGETVVYEALRFLSNNPLDPHRPGPGVDPSIRYPSLKKLGGRIIPVNSLPVVYWGNLDPKTGRVSPIALWRIRELKKPPLKDDDGDGILEVNSLEEIKSFLKALRGKDKFGIPLAEQPVLVKGGFLYQLDKNGEVSKNKSPQADSVNLSVSHGVVAGENVIGSRGCKDCHSKKSSFFLRKILVDPWDEKGKPVYAEGWELLGIDKEKLPQLLLEQ